MSLRAIACAASLALIACGHASPPTSAAAPPTAPRASHTNAQETPRSPEGVVLEVAAPMPAAAASSSARGIVVLAEPIPDEAIRETIFSYFDALRRRDMDAMRQLFASSAVRMDATRGHQGDREAILSLVASLMRQRDYAKISPAEIVVPEQIERYSLAELAATNQTKPEDMGPLDVFVRVAMPPPRGNAEKIFEDNVVFVLRAEGGKVHILTMNEESAPPSP